MLCCNSSAGSMLRSLAGWVLSVSLRLCVSAQAAEHFVALDAELLRYFDPALEASCTAATPELAALQVSPAASCAAMSKATLAATVAPQIVQDITAAVQPETQWCNLLQL